MPPTVPVARGPAPPRHALEGPEASAPHRPPDLDLAAERQHSGLLPLSPAHPGARPHPLPRPLHEPVNTRPTRLDIVVVGPMSTTPIVVAALALALALPSAAGPPWLLLERPASPTFLAAVSLLAVGATTLAPRPQARWHLALALALALAVSALSLSALASAPSTAWGSTLAAWQAPLIASGLVALASTRDAARELTRYLAASGLFLLLLPALVPASGPPLVVRAFSSLSTGPLAELALAACALASLLGACATAIIAFTGPARALPHVALATWSLALIGLALHALASTPPERWTDALAPLAAALVAGATILFAARALALLTVEWGGAPRG